MKVKIWKLGYADTRFSNHIRARDGGCRRCGRSWGLLKSLGIPLDCSHYWKRGDKGTRYDPKNCIALCRDCHTIWERQQNLEYKAFMIKGLGKEEYDALERRARTVKQQFTAILEVMELLNEKSAEAP